MCEEKTCNLNQYVEEETGDCINCDINCASCIGIKLIIIIYLKISFIIYHTKKVQLQIALNVIMI